MNGPAPTDQAAAPSPQLIELVTVATTATATQAAAALGRTFTGDRRSALADLAGLIRQAPLSHVDRTRLLVLLQTGLAAVPTAQIRSAADLVRTSAPRFPGSAGSVRLSALDATLTATFGTLLDLDQQVAAPWTLIGGLMVLTHCTEHEVPFVRPTGDADVAVGVFSHRDALAQVTTWLRRRDFTDITPAPLTGGRPRSYRWSDGQVLIDIAVPAKANEQQRVATTASGRPGVELPALQQALRRSERLQLSLADGTNGHLRRPDLLAALVLKAQAAVSDRRDTDRHREDLVALAEALAHSGWHGSYRPQLRPKDTQRLAAARPTITSAQWRRAQDPIAARTALDALIDSDRG